jgi:RNase P subunit RPR2
VAVFKELDPELHLKLVEGYIDELTPASKKQEAFLQANRKCKRCGCAMVKEVDPRVAWQDGEPLPRVLLRCKECGFLLDPETMLILDTGSAAKIPMPIIPEYKR